MGGRVSAPELKQQIFPELKSHCRPRSQKTACTRPEPTQVVWVFTRTGSEPTARCGDGSAAVRPLGLGPGSVPPRWALVVGK